MFDISNKIKNIIYFISDRRFFWSIMLAYVFIKLLPVIAFDKRFTYVVVFVSFIILIVRIIKLLFYGKKIVINRYRITSIVFIIICSFSIIYNIGFDFSNFNIRNNEYRVFIVLIINLFVLFSFYSNSDFNENIRYIKNISIIISVFSFFYIIFCIIDSIINKRDRIWGLTNSVWSFTHFVSTSFAINLYLLICEKKQILKKFYILNMILHLFTLIFVQQRAGYLCIVIGLFFTSILLIVVGQINIIKNYLIENKMYVLLVVIVLIFAMFLIGNYISLDVLKSKFFIITTSGRSLIKEISLKYLLENKAVLFGLIGNLYKILINVEYTKIHVLISEEAFHDIFLCILMCFGLFAFVVFSMFIIQIIVKLFLLIKFAKVNEELLYLLILGFFVILGSIVSSFFDDNMIVNLPYLPNLLFFILSSVLCSIDIKEFNIDKELY